MSVVDITNIPTAPKGPPKPEEVVAMLRRAVDSCLLFGGMSPAQARGRVGARGSE